MSADAIEKVTIALRQRVIQALREDDNSNQVQDSDVIVGPPALEGPGAKISLYLFLIQANAALRNEEHFSVRPPDPNGPKPSRIVEALPLDLWFLITAFGGKSSNNEAKPEDFPELKRIGRIIKSLHVSPTLSGSGLDGQVVRVTLESHSVEEINRIWGLFPPSNEVRTSLIYLVSPVFIEAGSPPSGPPVKIHDQRSGLDISAYKIATEKLEVLA